MLCWGGCFRTVGWFKSVSVLGVRMYGGLVLVWRLGRRLATGMTGDHNVHDSRVSFRMDPGGGIGRLF